MLIVWWFWLVMPLILSLKSVAGIFLAIDDAPGGNWTLHVALDAILSATPERAAEQVHSVDFDMQHADLIAFTFSLPLFWSLMLAAPNLRRNLRPLLTGTALMAVAELLMLLAFAQIEARNSLASLVGTGEPVTTWARHLGEYLIVSVLPFLLPFIAALSLHPELRAMILPSKPAEPESIRRKRQRR